MLTLPMNWPSRAFYRRMVEMAFGKDNGRRWAREDFAALREFREWCRIDDQVRILGRYEGNLFCDEIPSKPGLLEAFISANLPTK